MNTFGSRTPCIAILNETVGVGGAETLILQLAEELAARGRRIVCVLPDKDGWLTDEIHLRGFPLYTFRIRHPFDTELVRQLCTSLTSEGVDVVHSHEFAMGIFGTAVAGMLRRPHVITMHGNQTILDDLKHRVLLRWALRNSDATVAVSQATKAHMVKRLNVAPEAIHVIRNGVPVRQGDRETTRDSLGVDPGHVLLLATGSLVERKGFHVLVQALALLCQGTGTMAPWKLVIAGEGSFRSELQTRINALQLQERVQLLGYRSDIPNLQAAADIFVMPSLWEGLPLAVLEAMSVGNPVVASRTSGIPEAINDGEDGLLVPPGEAESLANALASLIFDREKRSRLGSAALRRALNQFTITRMADDYESLYWRKRPTLLSSVPAV